MQLRKKGLFRLWFMQLVVILLLTTGFFWLQGNRAALSALLGGLVFFLPNLLFAICLFWNQGARSSRKIVNGFYKAEALKIITTLVLLIAVFTSYKIMPLAFFVSLATLLMTHWLTPCILTNK